MEADYYVFFPRMNQARKFLTRLTVTCLYFETITHRCGVGWPIKIFGFLWSHADCGSNKEDTNFYWNYASFLLPSSRLRRWYAKRPSECETVVEFCVIFFFFFSSFLLADEFFRGVAMLLYDLNNSRVRVWKLARDAVLSQWPGDCTICTRNRR